MRPLLRRLLALVIRRTPPPPLTPRESFARLVADAETLAVLLSGAELAGDAWRKVGSS